tara:strand:+ start:315 stop:1082 length:768 start_codon:yes stop_codon:yes gene_type:complete
MAFLGLFKKKAKKEEKAEDIGAPKLEPVVNSAKLLDLPKPPEIPIQSKSISDIPPIKAPDHAFIPKSLTLEDIPKPLPPKAIPPISAPLHEEGVVIPKNIKTPFMSSSESTEIKSPKPFHTHKKKEIKPKDVHKEELPEFKDVKFKEKQIGGEIKIPRPPHYLSHIAEAREGVSEELTRSNILRKPIFVEVNDYRKVIDEIRSIKKDSKKSKEIVRSLEDFKVKNSSKLKKWEKGLEKIQRDLVFMDKVLFEETG